MPILQRILQKASTTFALLMAPLLFSLFSGFFIQSASVSAAQTIPYKINFQGRLTDNNGNIVADGLYNVKFSIFNAASGGTQLWQEFRQVGNRVQITNGLFDVRFGDVTALPPSLFNSSTQLYLQVELPTPATANCATSNCGSFTEGPLSPRQPIAATPYAFNTDMIDGIDGSQLARNDQANTFSGNQTINGTLTATTMIFGANTVCHNGNNCNYAAATGSGSYIQNGVAVQTANFNITGNGVIGGTSTLTGAANLGSSLTVAGASVFNGNVTLGTADKVQFATEAGDKIYYYGTSYGRGIEANTLTDWAQGRYRIRLGGTSSTTGSERLTVTTTGVKIGGGDATQALDVVGNSNVTGTYKINGTDICTSSGCTAASGSNNYIQNGTSPQSANFNISGDGTIGGNLTVSSDATFNGNVFSPSASGITRSGNSPVWVELSSRFAGTGYLGDPQRIEIEVTGGSYQSQGKTIYSIKFRDGLVMNKQDFNGGAGPLHDIRIYGEDVLATNSNQKYKIGLYIGNGSNWFSFSVRARSHTTRAWIPITIATEPTTGYTNETPSPTYGDFATGTITASAFQGSGASLTNLNASNLTTGTVASARISGSYTGITAVGTLSGLNVTGNGIFSGSVTANSFTGNGSGLTNLNASNLTTGTIADARISGSYTGLTNLTGTGTVDFSRFLGNAADTAGAPSFSWSGDLDTGIFQPAADVVGISAGGTERLRVTTAGASITGNLSASGTISGNGSGLSNVDADQLGGYTETQLGQNIRANVNVTGGGTVSWITNVLKWSSRLIVMSNGRGTNFGTNGYFDINMPTSGTITGVGGAANVTATASGIPLSSWQALYYIMPIGSNNTTLPGNFRVASYTANYDAPSNWLLLAIVNGDNQTVKIANGMVLRAGQQSTSGSIDNAVFNSSVSTGTITASGIVSAASFQGSGASLTNLNASNLTTGTVADSLLSSNVALRNTDNTFTGNISAGSGSGWAYSAGNGGSFGYGAWGRNTTGIQVFGSSVAGDTYWRYAVTADGTITWGSGAATTDTNLYRSTVNSLRTNASLTVDGTLIAAALQGSGANITSLNGSNISAGTVADGRLSSNVALKSATSNFTGALQQNGNAVCHAGNNCGYAASTGSSAYIHNSSTAQTANLNITGTATVGQLATNTITASSTLNIYAAGFATQMISLGAFGPAPVAVINAATTVVNQYSSAAALVVKGAASQSTDYFNVRTSNDYNLLSVSSGGTLTVQPLAGSYGIIVKDEAGNTLLSTTPLGGLTIGNGGSEFNGIKKLTTTWDPPSVNNATTASTVYSFDRSVIILGVQPPATPTCNAGGLFFGCNYSYGGAELAPGESGGAFTRSGSSNTNIRLSFHNANGSAVNPASGTWTIWYMEP